MRWESEGKERKLEQEKGNEWKHMSCSWKQDRPFSFCFDSPLGLSSFVWMAQILYRTAGGGWLPFKPPPATLLMSGLHGWKIKKNK